jgi:PIN domain nuclease of toxin-antitoxin system
LAFLLDTVAVIMWWGGAPLLGRRARATIEDGGQAIFFSTVSVWEIANKNRIGKLSILDGFEDRFPRFVAEGDFRLLDIGAPHAMRAGYLPGDHRDPFDRLIAGQALVEDMTVITNDPAIAAFGCKVLW